MAFNSLLFWFFFLTIYILFHFVCTSVRQRIWLIIGASFVFMASHSLEDFALLTVMTATAFWIYKMLLKTAAVKNRKLWLWGGVGLLLLPLLAAKTIQSYNLQLGLRSAIPLGLSFYTFQAMAFVIDQYRNSGIAGISFLEYWAFQSFFPHISAGPILRAKELIPKLKTHFILTWEDGRAGIILVANGLFKKTVGDLLGLMTKIYFGEHLTADFWSAWTGVLALGGQFYADFSGYSDMAIGCFLLLGFRVPGNFDTPFFAHSVAEHWRRWHMSLVRWISDYIFMPLVSQGGWFFLKWNQLSKNQVVQWTVVINIFITTIVMGIWHGFTSNCLIWGIYNGILLGGYFLFFRRRRWSSPFLGMLLTFYLTSVGRVLFRTEGFSQFLKVLSELHHFSGAIQPSTRIYLSLAILGVLVPHVFDHLILHRPKVLSRWSLWILYVFGCLMFSFSFSQSEHSFLYSQF